MVSTFIPRTLQEALAIRRETEAHPFAGGTDLMVAYYRGVGVTPVFPWPVMLISGLEELKGIQKDTQGNVIIGALEISAHIAENPLVPWHVRQAAGRMGAISLRNQATIGGNIGNASPKGDLPATLILLDAMVELQRVGAKRLMKVDDFILATKKTQLAPDELITKVIIPEPQKEFTYVWYRKIGTRRANAISKLSLSAAITLSEEGLIEDFRASSGAAGPKVERSREVEKLLIGRDIHDIEKLLPSFLDAYDTVICPHAMPEFRRLSTRKMLQYFLLQCVKRPQSQIII
ncbi:MAG: FAD binding domain-containing protein [Sphaerochaetaceae bacterium]